MYLPNRIDVNLPSPIQQLVLDWGIKLDVKREDLIHEVIRGNKYRKLKYAIDHYYQQKYNGIITFGGAYSNHIHATAGMGKALNIPTVGIIRGEEVSNVVLKFCKECGMTLHFVNRDDYRMKQKSKEINDIISWYQNHMLINEGGSGEFAMQGISELVYEINDTYDFIAVAAGTGCTAAGIIQATTDRYPNCRVLVFSALKGNWMKDEIMKFLPTYFDASSFDIYDDFCEGGYGKINAAYLKKVESYQQQFGFFIDKIYNGKLLNGLHTLSLNNKIPKDSKILWINTGGVVL